MTYLTGTGQVTHMVFASHFHQRDVSPLQRAVVKKESHSQAQVNSPTVRTMALLFSSHHFYSSAKSLVVRK